MAGIIDELKRMYRHGGIVTRLIAINVVLFVLFALLRVGLLLFNVTGSPWLNFLSLPAWVPELGARPWSLLTYMFMHANFWHLLFNMLWLYWFGELALHFFSARHLRGLYIAGGLAGALLFIVGYNVFPMLSATLPTCPGDLVHPTPLLVGASASILAIVIATAVREPNYKIRLLFIGSLSMKWLAVITVLMDILLIASDNAGGHLAHLGGALIGWWFAVGLAKGYDITAWANAVIDFVGGLLRPRQHKPHMKVVHRHRTKKKLKEANKQSSSTAANDHATDYSYNQGRKQQSEEIDRILEKIKQNGYAGLTADEKKKLFEASGK